MQIKDDCFSQIIHALHFAADKHKDQRRKDAEGSPYINHPIKVLQILWNEGQVRDPDTLIASVLHDTLEDTQTSPSELTEQFGKLVCRLVQEVTDDKSLPKQTRKQLQIKSAAKKSDGAKQIKIADKVSNLRDVINAPPEDWDLKRRQEYVSWAESVYEGLRGVNDDLDLCFIDCLSEARQKLSATGEEG